MALCVQRVIFTLYNFCMPIATLEVTADERYAYLLKTNTQTRRRVQRVQKHYGVSYNDALNILLAEALDARAVPNE